jgi:hypothetical protein
MNHFRSETPRSVGAAPKLEQCQTLTNRPESSFLFFHWFVAFFSLFLALPTTP